MDLRVELPDDHWSSSCGLLIKMVGFSLSSSFCVGVTTEVICNGVKLNFKNFKDKFENFDEEYK